MISKPDILERAREWQLRPEVVEKDYVLGWLLAAIALNEDTSASWILKGGTCVKKCFFETYRFSEDLDFTLLPEAAYSEEDLKSTLRDITEVARDLSGIEFSSDALSVRERRDLLGRMTFEGKIGYRGPLAMPSWPRVLFDLTQHEPVIDEPVLRAILHPYPDAPLPENALVSTYSIEELIAEKTRALFERTRPRDLYDVVYILTNSGSLIELTHAREVFGEKCTAKNIVAPDVTQMLALVAGDQELAGEWSNMLSHQLPSLPPIESVITRLAEAIAWLEPLQVGGAAATIATRLPQVAVGANETILAPAPSRLWGTAVPLETIRFAGANRLLIEFAYNGKQRTLEPYSLRRSSKGNLLLYAWELETSQIKCFDVGKIGSLRTTSRAFVPRYSVEFTASGAINTWTPVSLSPTSRTFRRASRQRAGPIYVFRCPVCGKEFRHTRRDSSLRRHKMADSSYYCSSRRGIFDRVV